MMLCLSRFIIVIIIQLLLTVGTSRAMVFYVDGSGGNDTNNGLSAATAWQTIKKVNSFKFIPGDSVLFRRGVTWRESIILSSPGTKDKPISYGAYGTGINPVISGADAFTTWTLEGAGSYTVYYSRTGIEPSQVTENNARLKKAPNKDGLQIPGTFWWDSLNKRVYVRDTEDADPTNQNVEISQRDWPMLIQASNLAIDNLIVEKPNNNSVVWGNTPGRRIDNVTITNCEFRNSWAHGVSIGASFGSDIIIANCKIYDVEKWGVNIYKHTGASSGHECVLRQNTIYACLYGGVTLRGNYWIIEKNYIHDTGSYQGPYNAIHAMSEEGENTASHNIIRQNYIFNHRGTGGDGGGIAVDSFADFNEVYYNIVTHCDGSCIYAYDAANVKIFNNTCYNNSLDRDNNPGDRKAEFSIGASGGYRRTNNIEMKNNIGVATCSDCYSIWIGPYLEANARLDIASNDWFKKAQGPWWYREGRMGNELIKWTYLPGVTGDINSDPMFRDPTNYDFSLGSKSPCIDAGTNLGLMEDIFGTPVPQGKGVDIGAIEYTPRLQPPRNLRRLGF